VKVYYKATRTDGTDFYSGTVDYAAALTTGQPTELDAKMLLAKLQRRGDSTGLRGVYRCDTCGRWHLKGGRL
jgi:hypothetical protein